MWSVSKTKFRVDVELGKVGMEGKEFTQTTLIILIIVIPIVASSIVFLVMLLLEIIYVSVIEAIIIDMVIGVLIGVLGLVGTYFVHRAFNFNIFTLLLGITHIGAIGVGLFTEATATFTMHVIFSLITYLFGGLAAIMSYKLQKQPLSILSVSLGVFSILAMVLLASQTYLGLGLGGMERMVAYPALLWVISFGGYMIGSSADNP